MTRCCRDQLIRVINNGKKQLIFKEISSPVGPLLLCADSHALLSISWGSYRPPQSAPSTKSNALIETAIEQLHEYFEGKRSVFALPMRLTGSPFQVRVWQTLQEIPFSKTTNYAHIAKTSGHEKAVRAVGTAIGKNPLPIIIPCHRVIGTNGTLRGFAGGLDRKKILLDLEARYQNQSNA